MSSRAPYLGLLSLLILLCTSCRSCDENAANPASEVEEGELPPLLVRGCLQSPEKLWADIGPMAGINASIEQVAARISGVPTDQLEGEIDWERPLTVALVQPPEKRLSTEAVALVLSRPAGASRPSGGVDRRRITTAKAPLHLRADGTTIALSLSEWTLAAASAEAHRSCDPEQPGETPVSIEVTPELLSSRDVVQAVARRGAWLEATAREATARKGRPTLGDPETLARMLAARLEKTRARAVEAGMLRFGLTSSSEGLQIELRAASSPFTEGGSSTPPPRPPPLKLLPPDAYFVLASWATGDERREGAKQLVESWARIAGDRLAGEERQRFDDVATRVALARDGWFAIAFRPALRPGPLLAVAVIETGDASGLIEALIDGAELLTQGYLGSALEHLGARAELAETRRGEGEGELLLRFSAPEGVPEERGSVLRALTGANATLAWRTIGEDRVAVAFGPDSTQELARLAEADAGAASSILTHPVLSGVIDARPGADYLLYALPSALGSLFTRGAPMARGLTPDGVAAATGGDDGQWRATIHLGPEQVGSLFEASFTSGDES